MAAEAQNTQADDDAPNGLQSFVSDVSVDLTVVLGQTMMPVHELLRLGRGAVIALDRTADDDICIYSDGLEVASGQLRLNGEQIEVSVTSSKVRAPSYRRPSDPFKLYPLAIEDKASETDPVDGLASDAEEDAMAVETEESVFSEKESDS
ncbi:MAG: FliM/FliN family flagellar motor switch protein [Pseudomonadota bacterium]